jgi:hypothetical protein
MFVIPNTKHIASKIFDFPDPFSPVIELNVSSLHGMSCDRVAGGEGVNKPARNDRSDGVRFEALRKVRGCRIRIFVCLHL